MDHNANTAFTPAVQELADWAKALAHPARVRILQILAQTPGCLCGDIVSEMPLAQATVSQHLKELKRVGLIQGRISGPRTCYCLDAAVLTRAQQALNDLFAGIGCCGPAGSSKGELHELDPQSDGNQKPGA